MVMVLTIKLNRSLTRNNSQVYLLRQPSNGLVHGGNVRVCVSQVEVGVPGE